MQDWRDLSSAADERFRLLVMNISDVAWTTDRDGRTTFVGPNITRVYGFTPEEICRADDRLWLDKIHPEDRERVQEASESLFSRDGRYDVEYRIQSKDGRSIWLHDRAVTTDEEEGVRVADGRFT